MIRNSKFAAFISKGKLFPFYGVLIVGLLLRVIFLGAPDLIDPTETRYATVAQEMLISGDWITPKIQLDTGLTPYLGKPPMYFWLTAVSYKFFCMNEWASRLPSFLSALGVLIGVYLISKSLFETRTAIYSCLITYTSVMFFFLSGATVTDMTLTMSITLAVGFLYKHLESGEQTPLYTAAFFAAFGFLTKGPVAIILIGFPFVLWSILIRDLSNIRSKSLMLASLIFLGLVAPWFVLCELKNPGFLKYFFWNENIARYLMKDYGDRYGSGHIYWYGSAWLMLAAAFLPWTFLLLLRSIRDGIKTKWSTRDKKFLFIVCWVIATPLFFTFVRQLHAMYLLPSIPPLGILLGLHSNEIKEDLSKLKGLILSDFFIFILISIALVIAVVGRVFNGNSTSITFILLSLILTLLVANYGRDRFRKAHFITVLSGINLFFYTAIILSFSPYISSRWSTEAALEEVASRNLKPDHIHKVGVTGNIYSALFLSRMWERELGENMDVEYVPFSDVSSRNLCYYVVKSKYKIRLPDQVLNDFSIIKNTGDWLLYARKA